VLNIEFVGSIHQVGLNLDIFAQEFNWEVAICYDSTYLGRSNDYGFWLVLSHEIEHSVPIAKVKFISGCTDPVIVSSGVKLADNSGSNQATMAGYKNLLF
jgi:hypothetical protein